MHLFDFAKKVFSYSGLLLLGKVATSLVFLVTARSLGPEEFGKVSLAIICIMLASELGSYGLNQWYQKQNANGLNTIPFWIPFKLRIVTLAISLVVIGVWLSGSDSFTLTQGIYILATVIPDAVLSLFPGYFISRGQLKIPPLAVILRSAPLVIPIALSSVSVDTVLLSYCLGTWAAVLLWYPRNSSLKTTKDKSPSVAKLIKQSTPYAALQATSLVYARADSLAVQYRLGAYPLGLYGVAYRYLEGVSFLLNGVHQLMFARAAKTNGVSWHELKQIVFSMAIVGSIAGTALFLSAEYLTTVLLGPAFAPAAAVVKILSGVLVLMFINAPLAAVVQSSNTMTKFLPFGVANTALNLLLNFSLVSYYGISIAAGVNLLTELTGALINWYFVRKIYGKKH